MRFAFDDDHLALRDAVRVLLAKECTPADIRAAWDTGSGRSARRWAALAEMGVVGLAIPEDFGGLGMDEVAFVLVLEAVAHAGLPEPLGTVAAVAAPLLCDAAAGPLAAEWLPRVAAGDAVVVAALPGQPYVDDAHWADLLLLTDGTALHAVAPTAVRLTHHPSIERSRRLFRVDWHPSDATLLQADATTALAVAQDRATLVAAASALGVARRLTAMATEYAGQREQFGVPIGSFQAVKHQLATALVRTEFAAPAVYRSAWSVATGHIQRRDHVAMARTLATQAAHLAGRTALQVHGAIGYTDEHDLHLWLRQALRHAPVGRRTG